MESNTEPFPARKWLEQVVKQSEEDEESLLNSENPDDTCEWGALLSGALETREFLGPVSGFLLTGPSGCGKHTAAQIAAKALVRKGDNELCFVHISGAKLAEYADSPAEIKDRIQALMDYFSSEESDRGPCFLFDQMERCFCREEAEQMLAERFRRFRFDQIPLFVFWICQNHVPVSASLQRELRRFVLKEPDSSKRETFLRKQAGDMEQELEDCHISYELLAEKTEGFTYKQLDDLLYSLKLRLWKYGEINLDELHILVEAQKGVQTEGELKKRWMEAMISFMEHPFVMQGIAGEENTVPVKNDTLDKKMSIPVPESGKSVREHFEEMPMADLLNDLLGEGVYDQIREEVAQNN